MVFAFLVVGCCLVDLVLTGHEHCYERTLPVYNMTVYGASEGQGQPGDRFVRPGAPVHVMVGTGGESPDWKWKPKATWPWYFGSRKNHAFSSFTLHLHSFNCVN
jgi:hypothetical protein